MARKINSRVRTRNRPQFPNKLLESILLRQHIKQILTLAYLILNPLRIQEVLKPHSISMTISLHLEHKIIDISKAKATVPTSISQKIITLPIMRIPSLPSSIPMNRSPPALIIKMELKGVQVVPELKMESLRNIITPPEKIDSMSTRNLIGVGHDQKIIIGDAGEADELIQSDSLVGLLDKGVLPFDESAGDGAVGEAALGEGETSAALGEKQGFDNAGEGGVGFEKDELGDVGMELVPADGEDVKLVVEEDGIKNAAGSVTDAPAVEAAELGHGDVGVVVVRDSVEGFGRGLPKRA